MASSTTTKKLREEATCCICLELMTEPVSINCGHSYCCQCIVGIIEKQCFMTAQRSFQCPQCRATFKRESLRPNKQLQNLIEAIKETECEKLCETHREQLHLFCENDEQLICWRCERAEHKGHSTALVEDIYQSFKEKLEKTVTVLKDTKEQYKNLKLLTRKQITDWEEKTERRKQQIHADFKNLHMFLYEEEKSYIWKLEKVKDQTLENLLDRETKQEKQIQELKDRIVALERKCQGSAQNLLQDIKDTLSRNSAINLVKPKEVFLELNTVCNVSELYFDVTKMLRRYQANVILDPETAHPNLVLSKDQRQVTHGCVQKKPDIPGRFSVLPCVLGCGTFTSGRHYFEVDVGEGTQWDFGVCLENVERNVDTIQGPQSGFWAIRLSKDKGYVALTSLLTPLHLKEHLEVVGVFLDYDAGFVSFYNMNTGSHIYTFPKASFSHALRPYFQVYHHSPLFLPPPDK
ncbi:E3 ubiquitin-protein ligase TRIM38-like [Sorex fumeus]|uniref:E3 ubiquitin-protein ligase TRIM38-like n=1 Tax=Sorex fumeus TaxID=62283 RepID=UPI0024ACB30F|nr:E3 ubiquitin-protein ligase TRIM38-like [Sorex fumeus]XP_055988449.1 E3 ubiquitin-protein ligase TRIM38-like [Sorex fumeus]XP_055988450.1 E3 ubiquitin-protein ligase TRIM38-like [Sorex fumeus]XP_055988451.1 E3 ubiquitin-protein ligase TRIM38-like [Sorex fumeus]